jgi:undecaprenyl-diphosphatase
MNLLHAIVLGIVQGLTEFIPVSSSGHLIIAKKLMGLESVMTPEQITAFDAVMQLGTLAAVIVYFFSDIISITFGFISGNLLWLRGERDQTARKGAQLGWLIILGTVPIVVIGLAFKKVIEGAFTKSLYVIGISMIVWAVLLWLAEQVGNRRREMEQLRARDAAFIGLIQAFALIPGSSRSGTTITAALVAGLTRETAARFSFLLSIPAIAGSGLLELKTALEILSGTSMLNLAVATVVAGVVGYLSIAFLISYLRRNSTNVFVIYRLIAGLVVLGFAFKAI